MLTDTQFLSLLALNAGGLAYGLLGAFLYDRYRPDRRAARAAERRSRDIERAAADLARLAGVPVELNYHAVPSGGAVAEPTPAEVEAEEGRTDGPF